MKRFSRVFLLVCLSLALLTVTALADTGPTSRLTVKVKNAPQELYYLDLLSMEGSPRYPSLTEEELAALGVWQKDAVLAARLAPSAANFQPWKIEADKNSVSILEASVIYKKYAPLDRGIAMLHAAVGAYHAGREAVWKKVDGGYQMRA